MFAHRSLDTGVYVVRVWVGGWIGECDRHHTSTCGHVKWLWICRAIIELYLSCESWKMKFACAFLSPFPPLSHKRYDTNNIRTLPLYLHLPIRFHLESLVVTSKRAAVVISDASSFLFTIFAISRFSLFSRHSTRWQRTPLFFMSLVSAPWCTSWCGTPISVLFLSSCGPHCFRIVLPIESSVFVGCNSI